MNVDPSDLDVACVLYPRRLVGAVPVFFCFSLHSVHQSGLSLASNLFSYAGLLCCFVFDALNRLVETDLVRLLNSSLE